MFFPVLLRGRFQASWDIHSISGHIILSNFIDILTDRIICNSCYVAALSQREVQLYVAVLVIEMYSKIFGISEVPLSVLATHSDSAILMCVEYVR